MKTIFVLRPSIELNEDMPDVEEYLKKFYTDLKIGSKSQITDALNSLSSRLETATPNLIETTLRVSDLPLSLRNEILNESKNGKNSIKGDKGDKRNEQSITERIKEFESIATSAMATTISADVKITKAGTANIIETKIPIHIKAYARMLKFDVFKNEMTKALNKKGGLFSFITWLSGEKGTLRDNIIGVEDIKDEAMKAARGDAPLSTVKRMQRLSKSSLGQLAKGVLPNTSFVISSEMAQILKDETKKDLFDYKTVTKLMNEYNLLSFVIVDENNVHVTSHEVGYTNVVPISALTRAKAKDNSYDQMLKLFKLIR